MASASEGASDAIRRFVTCSFDYSVAFSEDFLAVILDLIPCLLKTLSQYFNYLPALH
jgi:hypothetical protein